MNKHLFLAMVFSHAEFSIRFLLFYRFFDRFFINSFYNPLKVHASNFVFFQ